MSSLLKQMFGWSLRARGKSGPRHFCLGLSEQQRQPSLVMKNGKFLCRSAATSSKSVASTSATTFNHPMNRPLQGITVVALEQVISGPYCTRQLADLGARVIKIERPTGDFVRYHDTRVNGLCSHFVWTNRSKESVVLDIKKAEDLESLKQLVQKADIFVQNLVPGAAERYGLTFDKLHGSNPSLIVCDISGYGNDGPYKNKKAYDLLVQAEAGLLSITGTPSSPSKVGCSISDIAAGMYAYSNILAALLQRQKTGKGCAIDISMLEATVEWMGFPMLYASDGQEAPQRSGASHASIYPYGIFECKDGQILMGLQNEREWSILCNQVLLQPSLETDERFTTTALRSTNRQSLYDIICAAFKQSSSVEVIKQLDLAGIANARLNEMKDVWNHPQLKARQRFEYVNTEAGPVKVTVPPGMTGGSGNMRLEPVPTIGQHTVSVFESNDKEPSR